MQSGGNNGDDAMQSGRYWHIALVLAIAIHGLVLAGVGASMTNDSPADSTPEEYMTMELLPVKEPSLSSINEPADAVPNFVDNQSAPQAPAELKEQPPLKETDAKSAEETQASKADPPQPVMAEAAQKAVPGQLLLHYDKNQLYLALAQYNQALKLNPHFAFAYSNRGQVYFDLGDFDKALADFSQALTLNPRLAPAYIGRGFVYIKKGQWQPAMNDFSQAVTLVPESALSYYGRALCYIVANDKQKAGRDFQLFLQYATPDYNRLILAAQQFITAWGHPPGTPDSSHKIPGNEK